MEESQRAQPEWLEVRAWAAGLESRVSPGLAPTAAPLLHLTLLDSAAGRLLAPFVRRILTLAARRGHLTPDTTTTSDLSASATKAANQLSSRHVGAGHRLLLQSSALTAEDELDFLGGQSGEAQNTGGRPCTAL